MSVEELAEVKRQLEARLAGLEADLKLYQGLLSLVEAKLAAKKPQQAPEEVKPKPVEPVTAIPIRSRAGEELATMYVGEDHVRVVPSPMLGLKVTVPPFEAFFRRRLEEMRNEDLRKVEAGQMDPEEVMEYQVVTDGELLKEVVVRNLDDEKRLRELRSSVRWTLERMLEKVKARSGRS